MTNATATAMTVKQHLSLREVTGLMRRTEKRIAWYNARYQYGTMPMPSAHADEYQRDLNTWDRCKAHRDMLKSQS